MAKKKTGKNAKYTAPMSLYFTKAQRERITKRADELGWPSEVAYVRRLVVKHTKDDERYIDPDEA